jgi:hypothetical protein
MISQEVKNLAKRKLWTAFRLGFKFSGISNIECIEESDYFVYIIPKDKELVCSKLESVLFGESCCGHKNSDICKILGISLDQIKEVEEYLEVCDKEPL